MPPRWIRRLVSLPFFFVATMFAWTIGPLLVVLAAIYDAATRRDDWATARTVMYFIAFLTCEWLGLAVALVLWLIYLLTFFQAKGWFLRANYVAQRYWGRSLFWSCIQIYGMEVDFRSPDAFAAPGPKLFLVRHASTLDTMLPIVFCPDGVGFRYIMKEELLWDPCLDVVGNRLPNCFVKRGKGQTEHEVERVVALADDIQKNDALVIFPEGTRFTREKQAQLIERASTSDDPFFQQATETLFNTLPPLRRGTIELIKRGGWKTVVVVAHRGAEGAGALNELIHGGLVERRFVIEAWTVDREDVELTDDGIREFLLEQWTRVDLVAGGMS